MNIGYTRLNYAKFVSGLKRTGNSDSVNGTKQFDQPLFIPEQVLEIRKMSANAPVWQADEMTVAGIADDGIQARTALDFQFSDSVAEGTKWLDPAIPRLIWKQLAVGTSEMDSKIHRTSLSGYCVLVIEYQDSSAWITSLTMWSSMTRRPCWAPCIRQIVQSLLTSRAAPLENRWISAIAASVKTA